MIKRVRLNDVATYRDVEFQPARINFIFGGNGAGKTTLSRVLSGCVDTGASLECSGATCEVKAFNSDYIRANLGDRLNGIFTLGKEDTASAARIDELTTKLDALKAQVECKKRSIADKRDEVRAERERFEIVCWERKKKFEKYKEAFRGCLNRKSSFADECIRRLGLQQGVGPLKDLSKLSEEYDKLFKTEMLSAPTIELTGLESICEPTHCDLLEERVEGVSKGTVGTFIDFLGNSDWVKRGTEYYHRSNGRCPYCQRELDEDLERKIESYFDQSYRDKVAAVERYKREYEQYASSFMRELETLRLSLTQDYAIQFPKDEMNLLEKAFERNLRVIANKVSSPSQAVRLEDTAAVREEIIDRLRVVRDAIEVHNSMCRDLKRARSKCSDDIWAYVLSDVLSSFNAYCKSESGYARAIENMEKQIISIKSTISDLTKEKEGIERSRTSVLPTIDAINGTLDKFGFTGFNIASDEDDPYYYRIVRPNGEGVKDTLSEGERNFISFLYFYHSVYGSCESTKINANQVVVIDDPISSLDSSVMFIVTALIKDMLENCKNGRKGIRQMFILTHNVYFFKEVTFLGRDTWSPRATKFFVLRKTEGLTHLREYEKNPVSTSYELLWDEIRHAGEYDNPGIFNTMRRIIEYYFKIIGKTDIEKHLDRFDPNDRLAVKALIACINDGSHVITDDFVLMNTPDAIESYGRIFKEIFYVFGQGDHYEMMMRGAAEVPAGP